MLGKPVESKTVQTEKKSRIILKWILRETGMTGHAGFICLKVGNIKQYFVNTVMNFRILNLKKRTWQ
jgi:hypothetical protein